VDNFRYPDGFIATRIQISGFKYMMDVPSVLGVTHTHKYGYGSIPINTIFRGWTSIYQLFWCELQGYKVLTHCHIYVYIIDFAVLQVDILRSAAGVVSYNAFYLQLMCPSGCQWTLKSTSESVIWACWCNHAAALCRYNSILRLKPESSIIVW